MTITSDEQLVARCRAGETPAWNELVERYSRYVYAICTQGFRLRDHDAEDVFQDVFTRVSYRVIADALGLPAGTVGSRISRCLDKLKPLVEEKGGAGRPEVG